VSDGNRHREIVKSDNFEIAQFLHLKSEIKNLRLDFTDSHIFEVQSEIFDF